MDINSVTSTVSSINTSQAMCSSIHGLHYVFLFSWVKRETNFSAMSLLVALLTIPLFSRVIHFPFFLLFLRLDKGICLIYLCFNEFLIYQKKLHSYMYKSFIITFFGFLWWLFFLFSFLLNHSMVAGGLVHKEEATRIQAYSHTAHTDSNSISACFIIVFFFPIPDKWSGIYFGPKSAGSSI